MSRAGGDKSSRLWDVWKKQPITPDLNSSTLHGVGAALGNMTETFLCVIVRSPLEEAEYIYVNKKPGCRQWHQCPRFLLLPECQSWMGSPEAPRGLCDAPGMCSPKENVLLHCYSAGIIQALLSACRGAMTAEITCFHMALSALRRESLALNPLRCLVVYSFFNYTQSQVSTVTQFHFENQ